MNRWLDRLARRVIQRGQLKITWSDGNTMEYGDGSGNRSAHVVFRNKKAEWAVLRNPELAIGERYTEGHIEFPTGILAFLTLIFENWEEIKASRWYGILLRLRAALHPIWRNTLRRARRNVAHHYDLDGRLYRLFLDKDQQYSCAYFAAPGMSLEAAQLAKKQHLAAKLLLQPTQTVLDIGSGWGGLGLFLARQFGVNVTGVTLSTEQHAVSNQRAREMGLHKEACFELRDYRALDSTFDRIVSVGMFEHVGVKEFPTFFATLGKLLADDGVAVLHTIGKRADPGPFNAWVEKYIFPGAYLPTLSELTPIIERMGFWLTDLEILRRHYADTLAEWNNRFQAKRAEAARLYDERFCRMWEFYLQACEAGFRSGDLVVFQLQLAKRADVVPITRDYIYEEPLEPRQAVRRKLNVGVTR